MQVLRSGSRIAACMSRYFSHRQMFAATCNSLMLGKSLKQRMWHDSTKTCRQLPLIGAKHADRLAAAGVATLQCVAAAAAAAAVRHRCCRPLARCWCHGSLQRPAAWTAAAALLCCL
jgi:hypothetical protein